MPYSDISILIIDDEEDLAELCAEAFESEGLTNVSFVTTPGEALKRISEQFYHVILSDATMPEISGYDIFTKTKNCYKGNNYLFYFITGSVSIEKKEVLELGATGLIAKPFDLDEMVELVKNDIEKYLKE